MIQIRDFLPRIVQIVAHTKGGAVLWTLLVVLSRLPLVGGIFPDNIGLSSDVDASGIATSVMILWHEGRYIPSRPPGYFLNEAANALFYPLGWWSANLCWSLIYGLSCCVYARVLLILGIPHAFWVLVAYSFFPLIVVENASVTEYTLSNVFLVLSWYSLIRGQPVASGVWMGCALASRISQTPVALLIFAVALWARDRHWKSVVLFILAATVLTIALWLIPMRLLTSNWEFLAGAVWEGSLLQRVLAAGYDIYRAFGLLGMIVSVAYVFFRSK